MSLQPYPAYKNSGQQWLETLPAQWKLSPLKHIARLLAGGTPESSNDLYWAEGCGTSWVAIGDMSGRDVVRAASRQVSAEGMATKNLPVAPPGTVLFAMYASVGEVSILGIHATWNQALIGFVVDDRLAESRFVFYALKALRGWLPVFYRSNTQNNLNAEQVGNLVLPLPGKAEQRAIVSYLDQETAKLDAFIADQEELITLLKERRTATVDQVTNGGLVPHAPRKQSDINWIGEVPQHWSIATLSRLDPVQESGVSVNGHREPASEGDPGVLKTGAASKGYFDPTENKRVAVEDLARVTCPLRDGWLLVNRANTPELVGSVAFVTDPPAELYLSDKLWQIDFRNANNKFIYWWTSSTAYKSQLQFYRVGTSSSMQNLSYSDFKSLDVAVPPLGEQQEIAAYLDRETAEIDTAIADAHEAIILSKERRAAVISAAVTGKIDVRGLMSPASTNEVGAESIGVA